MPREYKKLKYRFEFTWNVDGPVATGSVNDRFGREYKATFAADKNGYTGILKTPEGKLFAPTRPLVNMTMVRHWAQLAARCIIQGQAAPNAQEVKDDPNANIVQK